MAKWDSDEWGWFMLLIIKLIDIELYPTIKG